MSRGLVTLLSFGMLGCGDHQYSITIWNKSGETVADATVRYREHSTLGGNVVSGGRKSDGLFSAPFPETVHVEWRFSDGEFHRVEREVARWIKKGRPFNGELFFIINPDLTVSFIPARGRTDGGIGYPKLKGLVEAADGKAYEPKEPV